MVGSANETLSPRIFERLPGGPEGELLPGDGADGERLHLSGLRAGAGLGEGAGQEDDQDHAVLRS